MTLYRNGLKLQQTAVDETGRFSFLRLTEGDYEVKIEAPGFRPYSRRVSLRYRAHEEERFSVRLRPAGDSARGAAAREFQTPTFRISTAEVVIDFLALDDSGRMVRDLRPEEIQVFEDGRKQKIHAFFSPDDLPREELVYTTQSPTARLGRPARSPDRTRDSERPAETVILIDSRVMDSNNFVRTVAAIRRFVSAHLSAHHAIMLAEINRGLKILTPLTRDRGPLLEALGKLRPQTVSSPLAASSDTGTKAMDRYLEDLQQQVFDVRRSLDALSYALSGGRGRKHVIYFSEGYSLDPLRDLEMRTRARASQALGDNEARMAASRATGKQKDPGVLEMVRDVVTTANAFGITFYTIDARGLVAVAGVGNASRTGDVALGPGEDTSSEQRAAEANPRGSFRGASDPGATEIMVGTFNRTDINNLEDSQNTLVALAAGTNGAAFVNSNDLASVLRASTLEQESYYVVSYVPRGKRKKGKFHQVRVKTRRRGVHVRERKGYLDLSRDTLRRSRILTAFRHPELFGQLEPLAQLEPGAGRLAATIGVPASQVAFRPRGGQFHAEILFLGQIYDSKGKPVSKKFPITRGFNLNLTRAQFQGLGRQPLLARSRVSLKPGRYRLVLVVEDRLGGTLGATSQKFILN